MTDMLALHFLRPWWLAGVPIAAVFLLWHVALQGAVGLWRGRIAPHLLKHLIVHPGHGNRPGPGVWLCALLMLSSVAMSGPSWERTPPPFANDSAALVVILDLSPSMLRSDPAPSRLLHARLKLRDLLSLRNHEKAALIVLGATAHRVLPFTQDTQTVRTYVDALEPRLMPPAPSGKPGPPNPRFLEALSLAQTLLAREGGIGSVLLVTDAPPPELAAPISPVVWTISTAAPPRLAWADSSIHWTADDTDVAAVNRALVRHLQAARDAEDGAGRWRDGGIFLLAPLVLFALLGARRGWSLRW